MARTYLIYTKSLTSLPKKGRDSPPEMKRYHLLQVDHIQYVKALPYFADEQIVGICPEESNLHILLDHVEATDMMNQKMRTVGQSMTKELMDCLYNISEGHAGCITTLMTILDQTVSTTS